MHNCSRQWARGSAHLNSNHFRKTCVRNKLHGQLNQVSMKLKGFARFSGQKSRMYLFLEQVWQQNIVFWLLLLWTLPKQGCDGVSSCSQKITKTSAQSWNSAYAQRNKHSVLHCRTASTRAYGCTSLQLYGLFWSLLLRVCPCNIFVKRCEITTEWVLVLEDEIN